MFITSSATKMARSSRNARSGVHCEGRATVIGGTVFAHRCEIFSNTIGVLLTAPDVPVTYNPGLNSVFGNVIGAESAFGGAQLIPRPNLIGVHITGSSQNTVGGPPRSAQANVILHNRQEGILVSSGVQNQLSGNLRDANRAFSQSTVARDLLGDTFVDHYAASRDWERIHLMP